MTAVLQKVRWIVFGVGLLAILIAGIGWATNAPWGNIFNSFSAIFGTMMSFAQMFISFPTTTIGFPKAKDSALPAQPQEIVAGPSPYANYQPQYPAYQPPARQAAPSPYHTPPPPPPPLASLYPSYVPPLPAQAQPTRYKKSGIALWIGAGCALLQINFFLMQASGHIGPQDIYDYYSVLLLQGICFLCALRGVHAKHAKTAGALGVLAILVIGGASLLSVIVSTIYVGNANSINYTLSSNFALQVLAFTNIDNIFIILGDLLLGVSLIYGKVYPTWIGITGIALGCIVFFTVLMQASGAPVPVGLFVLGALLSCVQNAATGWVLFKKPQPVGSWS